ncbi:MAG: hypothetical protein II931_02870 [Clostridia bacterium]|nr:hypothetical protein [Clostridia bacterium]
MKFLEVFSNYGIQALRIVIINKFLQSCIPGYDVYIYDDIPYSLYSNARSSYAYGVDYDDVIAMADSTVFSTCKKGLLFTKEGVYYKDTLSSTEYGEYGNLSVFDGMYSSPYYNTSEIRTLFKWLNNLEYLSYLCDGIQLVEEILDLSEDEFEEALDEMFEEVIIPTLAASAELLGQEVAYDFIIYIRNILEA